VRTRAASAKDSGAVACETQQGMRLRARDHLGWGLGQERGREQGRARSRAATVVAGTAAEGAWGHRAVSAGVQPWQSRR